LHPYGKQQVDEQSKCSVPHPIGQERNARHPFRMSRSEPARHQSLPAFREIPPKAASRFEGGRTSLRTPSGAGAEGAEGAVNPVLPFHAALHGFGAELVRLSPKKICAKFRARHASLAASAVPSVARCDAKADVRERWQSAKSRHRRTSAQGACTYSSTSFVTGRHAFPSSVNT